MYTAGERGARGTAMANSGAAEVRGAAAQRGSDGSGSDGHGGTLLRCGSGTSGAGGGGQSAPVQGDQRIGEEDGPPRCPGASAVSGQRLVAGGKNEAQTESRTDASGGDARPAGQAALGVEKQDQQPAGDAGDRTEAGSLVEQDCAGAGAGPPRRWYGATGTAGAGRTDPLAVGEHCGVGRAAGRRRPTTARIREPDQHQ